MIRSFIVQGNAINEGDIKLISVGKSNVWIDVTDPSLQELHTIHEKFDIPLSELQHCLDQNERPRIKTQDNLNYIYYRAHTMQESKGILPVMFILAKRFVITIHKQKVPAISELDLNNEVMKTLFKESAEFLVYKMLNGLCKETEKVIDGFEIELDHLEIDVVKFCNEKNLGQVFLLKKRIAYLRRACIADRDVIVALINPSSNLREKNIFAEIEVELMQSLDAIELLRERLTSIIEIYVTNTSNKINNVMKSITVVATLLSFPILVTGLYGMNVHLPLENHPQAFWIIAGLLILSVMTTVFFFARKKWL